MKTTARGFPFFLFVGLAGCAHLEQAPLVYTSKTTLGIEVSTASAEAPGLAMSVGFRQVDAAYVPVAVARPCPANGVSGGSDCSDPAYALQLVSGHSESGNHKGDNKSADATAEMQAFDEAMVSYGKAAEAARDADREVMEADSAIANLNSRIALANEAREKYERRQSELSQLEEQAAIAATSEAGAVAGNPDVQSRINEIRALKPDPTDISGLETQLKAAQSRLRVAKAEQQSLGSELKKKGIQLAQAKEAINQVNRSDSYSVFGSFEAKTSAGAADGEASVGLGKIFATGVASQNISDGLSDYYRTRAVTACYEAAAKLAGNIDGAALGQILSNCPKVKDYRVP